MKLCEKNQELIPGIQNSQFFLSIMLERGVESKGVDDSRLLTNKPPKKTHFSSFPSTADRHLAFLQTGKLKCVQTCSSPCVRMCSLQTPPASHIEAPLCLILIDSVLETKVSYPLTVIALSAKYWKICLKKIGWRPFLRQLKASLMSAPLAVHLFSK